MDNIKEKQGQIAIEAIQILFDLMCIHQVDMKIYNTIVNAQRKIEELENARKK